MALLHSFMVLLVSQLRVDLWDEVGKVTEGELSGGLVTVSSVEVNSPYQAFEEVTVDLNVARMSLQAFGQYELD